MNAFEPIIFYCLFQSIDTLAYAVNTFVENCVKGITANEERCRELVEKSVGIVTALSPHIGYMKAAELAKEALKNNVPIRQLVLDRKILNKEELDEILDVWGMTEPGISGRELLMKKGKKTDG